MDKRAFHRGFIAAQKGKNEATNPYTFATEAQTANAREWLRGHRCVKQDGDRTRPLTFHHTNGWTMSVAHNIGGVGYSVIAYATADKGKHPNDSRNFVFEGGHLECWCSSLSSLVTDAQEVLNALPPGSRVNPPVTNQSARVK